MSTEIATVDVLPAATGIAAAIESLSSGKGVLSTFTGESHEDKLKVLSAMTNANALADNLDKKIQLANFVVQEIEMTNEQTGELEMAARIILVDADGTAYAAVSGGILRSLQNIRTIMGAPSTWTSPIPVTARQVKGNKGFKFFTLEIG